MRQRAGRGALGANAVLRSLVLVLVRVRVLVLVLVLAQGLAGCASLRQEQPATSATVSGRFAVTAQANGRTDGGSGLFSLTTAGAYLALALSTPIGTTLAELESKAGRVRLTAPREDGGMATLEGLDAEALMRQAFGWAIPVDGLADWIVGRPAPGTQASVHTDAAGHVVSMEQSGWTIEIQERFAGAAGAPRRLRISRPAIADAPALTLRLVLDERNGALGGAAQ